MSRQNKHLRERIYETLEYTFYPEELEVIVNKTQVHIRITSFCFGNSEGEALSDVQSVLYSYFYEDLHDNTRTVIVNASRPSEDLSAFDRRADYD